MMFLLWFFCEKSQPSAVANNKNKKKLKKRKKSCNNAHSTRTYNFFLYFFPPLLSFLLLYRTASDNRWKKKSMSMETHFMQYYPIVNYARDYVSQEFHYFQLFFTSVYIFLDSVSFKLLWHTINDMSIAIVEFTEANRKKKLFNEQTGSQFPPFFIRKIAHHYHYRVVSCVCTWKW